ncbi:MAG TPA: hypothetical protein VGX48_16350 [Pyrinomonadaceae bacterium]|jgi:hypothetical protein|nr:hypothetical protein [Pyrinomonadaceae bacterium]
MYLFTIRSKIKPKSEAARRLPDVAGAYVNAWIQFKDYDAAEKLARLLIRERGWIPEETTDASIIQKKGLKKKRDKQFYAEAIKYGYTLVFNMWLKDAADAGINYEAQAK